MAYRPTTPLSLSLFFSSLAIISVCFYSLPTPSFNDIVELLKCTVIKFFMQIVGSVRVNSTCKGVAMKTS